MRFLLGAFFFGFAAWTTLTGDGLAVELERNGKVYDIFTPLPDGATFTGKGIDRKAHVKGVDISMRLIQDDFADCNQLVSERDSAWYHRGYISDAIKGGSKKECMLSLGNNGGGDYSFIDSRYIWLDMCDCYVAYHLAVKQGAEDIPDLTPLRLALRYSPDKPIPLERLNVDLEINKDWVEAFQIFKERGFRAELVFKILDDSVDILVGSRQLSDRYAEIIADLYGVSVSALKARDVATPDWGFDVETGYPLYKASPQDFASHVSTCYQNGKYWRDCQVNFHQEMGCRMTEGWKYACTYEGQGQDGQSYAKFGDLCWWEPRGDLPMLVGVGDSMEKTVQLPTQKLAAKQDVEYCNDKDWRETLQRDGTPIPARLLK
ncbi:hypothetical protein ABK249_28275 [Neorhizobium sp. Rsf11]|uniref:Uncharacterized protein n=2 Tax=Neorhizobium TaxID=1525371 RepID=A0ABV0MAG6_9HYPH|nr:hypothetical protein [Neorhizobium petrolearium]MCC2613903.1 hypothetical protein [Neorhizobium petrolearium]WGI71426.1 hypothetical protein QEO92_29240 [Neorhizobium petrolearium]